MSYILDGGAIVIVEPGKLIGPQPRSLPNRASVATNLHAIDRADWALQKRRAAASRRAPVSHVVHDSAIVFRHAGSRGDRRGKCLIIGREQVREIGQRGARFG